MAAPIIAYEVRWRRAGTLAAWKTKRFSPESETIEIPELRRGVSYEGHARSLGPSGVQPSAWVPVDFVVADASNTPLAPTALTAKSVADGVALSWSVEDDQKPDVEYVVEKAAASTGPWAQATRVRALQWTDPVIDEVVNWYRVRAISFAGVPSAYSNSVNEKGVSIANVQDAADAAAQAAADAQADADAALADLANIASDNVLTASEKPRVIQDRDELVNEQAGIDAQATAYGITTEKTAYDTAISALTSYLASLTTPTTWNNLAGNTTIVGVTFRQKFVDAYGARQTLLNAIYSQAKALAVKPAPNLIKNTSGAFGTYGWGGNGDKSAVLADDGYRLQSDAVPASTTTRVYEYVVPVSEGQPFTFACDYLCSGGSGSFYIDMQFKNSVGTVIHDGPNVAATPSGGWERLSSSIPAPANAVSATCRVVAIGTWSVLAWRRAKAEYSDHMTAFSEDASVNVVDFSRPGHINKRLDYLDGRLSGPSRQATVTWANFGAAWDGLTLSYTSTATSATITASAATLRNGDSIAYNSASVTVSGSAGTTRSYWLYYDDPDATGGSKTLNATATYINSITSNGRVYVGKVTVTYPSSGTGGGTQPPQNCVWVESWVIRRGVDGTPEAIQAGHVRVGDWLRVADPATGAERWGWVSMSRTAPAECVRVATETGTALTCSLSAPIGTRAGAVPAPDTLGALLAERRGGRFGHAAGVAPVPAGGRPVQHITCENDYFLAGDDPDALLAHHNIKQNEP